MMSLMSFSLFIKKEKEKKHKTEKVLNRKMTAKMTFILKAVFFETSGNGSTLLTVNNRF